MSIWRDTFPWYFIPSMIQWQTYQRASVCGWVLLASVIVFFLFCYPGHTLTYSRTVPPSRQCIIMHSMIQWQTCQRVSVCGWVLLASVIVFFIFCSPGHTHTQSHSPTIKTVHSYAFNDSVADMPACQRVWVGAAGVCHRFFSVLFTGPHSHTVAQSHHQDSA